MLDLKWIVAQANPGSQQPGPTRSLFVVFLGLPSWQLLMSIGRSCWRVMDFSRGWKYRLLFQHCCSRAASGALVALRAGRQCCLHCMFWGPRGSCSAGVQTLYCLFFVTRCSGMVVYLVSYLGMRVLPLEYHRAQVLLPVSILTVYRRVRHACHKHRSHPCLRMPYVATDGARAVRLIMKVAPLCVALCGFLLWNPQASPFGSKPDLVFVCVQGRGFGAAFWMELWTVLNTILRTHQLYACSAGSCIVQVNSIGASVFTCSNTIMAWTVPTFWAALFACSAGLAHESCRVLQVNPTVCFIGV